MIEGGSRPIPEIRQQPGEKREDILVSTLTDYVEALGYTGEIRLSSSRTVGSTGDRADATRVA